MSQYAQYFDIITNVVAVAAAIAAITPTPKDDGVLLVVRKLLDLLAFNVGNAKNARPAAQPEQETEYAPPAKKPKRKDDDK